MKFSLNYTPEVSENKISHNMGILMAGSCFAENIGIYLSDRKFKCLVNPAGILFNPLSISTSLRAIISNTTCDHSGIVNNGDVYFHLSYHGSFHASSENELAEKIDAATQNAHEFLKTAEWLIITLGSAHIYRYLKTGGAVANCHKLPQSEFHKELLKTEEIIADYSALVQQLHAFNPKLKVLFTISPVKYLRDGLIQNNLSKSILIQSIHEIVAKHSDCFYFPAYELVIDDLRDYRFFKEDMAHPNDIAIKYVWEKFSEVFFNKETIALNEKLEDIHRACRHRPIIENSEEHVKFKHTYLKKCELIEREFGYINLGNEKSFFS